MTNFDDELQGDCCEEELSDVQKKAYEDAIKEYEKAMAEVSIIQKGKLVNFLALELYACKDYNLSRCHIHN